jgi:hypothetical protein
MLKSRENRLQTTAPLRPRLRRALAAGVLFLAATGLAAPQAGTTTSCASCHRDQAHSQPATDMARALLLPGANPVLAAHPKLTFQRGDYSYEIETRDGASTYTVSDGKNRMSLPIRWPFGIQSQTWVFEYGGRFYESLVSYFAPINGLDITIGDRSIHPQTLLEAFGRELSDFETRSCFECHATRAVADGRLKLDSLIPGVQCERCHPGAERHLQEISHGKAESIPRKLGALSPEETANFCGQCHRTWERVVRDRLRGEINVRFQPYRMANSKCYDGGDRRMSCTTCHDPHHDIVRGAASYDSKCLACHSAAKGASASAKSCRVATSGCSNCHMPKVELPGGHMVFTDHQIRVVRAGEPYPN